MFQRRVDGSQDFYLDWVDYKLGFGDISREHWLGNDNIHTVTNNGKTYQLRIDLDDGFETNYALWASFYIMDESFKYILRIGSKIAGDGK